MDREIRMAKPKQRERPKTAAEHLREAELNRGRAAMYLAQQPSRSGLSRSSVRKWFALIAATVGGGVILWALAF
jgi:hypothetical protein